MDIGGHRFFSKSDRVMNWWMNILPLVSEEEKVSITYHNQSTTINNIGAEGSKGMLVRKRLSRIYFLRKFFSYPVQLSFDTLRKLGVVTTIKILASYCYAQLFPNKPEKSLEDFLINRFGKTLYQLFFKDYTEKVWGVPCHEIPAGWGAQRIKGVSISKAIAHAASQLFSKKHGDIAQKNTETSLIEQFLYPALGPGQLWDEVARQVVEMGGEIIKQEEVKQINYTDEHVTSIVTENSGTKLQSTYSGDYFFSTMPVQELIAGMGTEVPANIQQIAQGLQYRDFVIVGILLQQEKADAIKTANQPAQLKDTWIYIQERDVRAGRLQLFNNWSPYMVKTPGTVWMGMEYFCNKGDDFWQLSDEAIQQTAIGELEKMGLIHVEQVIDTTVHREEKTYPAYFGTYEQFDEVKEYVNGFDNLFLVGRNGMHKYNNSDHSMLTSMTAVDNIIAGVTSKENIWSINTEQEYHEEKKVAAPKNSAEKKWTIAAAVLLMISQFIIFKLQYPLASFMPDSSAYIVAAENKDSINFWPIGYSWFLRCFHAFSQSDTALVLFQYLLLQASGLWFVFTLFRFVQPGRLVRFVLPAFIVLNPLFLIAANYISADAVFITLSFIWATQLLLLIHKPSQSILIWHVVVVLLAFVVRFNSLYYPLISAVVIMISRFRLYTRVAAIGASALLIVAFSWYCSNQYKTLTGERQFAAFAGWQLAGNALYAYSHSNQTINEVPAKFTRLHTLVNDHIDSLSRLALRPDSMPGIYYQWKGPLEAYLKIQYPGDSNLTNFQHYATLAPMYKEYATYLIKNQPGVYLQYFVLPNLVKFYAPPAEFLGLYNLPYTKIPKPAVRWFNYNPEIVFGRTAFKYITIYMPVLSTVINLMFAGCLIGFIWMGGFRKAKKMIPFLLLMIALWVTNIGFSILASPVVLRYQLFIMTGIFCAAVLLTEFIYNYDKENYPGSGRHLADPLVRLRGYEQAAGV